MQKSFRKIPQRIRQELAALGDGPIEVRALVNVSADNIGRYETLGMARDRLTVGEKWAALPPATNGVTSKKNLEGWSVIRKDLPMYTKTFCHEIQNFGNASRNGWSTICRDREVYHRDEYPAPFHNIIVSIDENRRAPAFGVSFSIDSAFDPTDPLYEEDLLFALNLLQESVGECTVASAGAEKSYYSETLDWEIFPPESIDGVMSAMKSAGKFASDEDEAIARERLNLFERFSPLSYLRGLGGSETYIGAKFADDLVVFENLKRGNALYVLYSEWQEQSKKSRSELLRLSGDMLDRIIHRDGWQDAFQALLAKQLRNRGISLRSRRR